MLADGFTALATLLAFVAFHYGFANLSFLIFIACLRSVGGGFQAPAVNALYPEIVPREHLLRINGINQMANNVLLLLSPAAGGAILGMFGMQWTFLVDLLTAVIAIAIMFRLKIVTRAADRSDSSVLKELREGVRYTWSQPLLRVMLVCYAVTFVLITPAAFLSPLMVVRSFGSEVWKLTANEMLWSLGALLGGAFVAWKGEFKNKITMIAVSLAVFGCTFALMGLSPFLIIAFDNVLIISLNTVIQMYGGAEADMLLTCTTIVQSFMLIVTMPLGGITSGTGAILGFNFGAGRPDRIRSAQKYITLLAVVQCSIMFLFSRTLAQYFVYLFTRNESYVELTVWAIRVYTMGIIPLAVQYEVVDGFTGMGVPSVAISLSMFRKLLYLVSVFLIPVFAGVENVFYAEVVSDFGGTTVSVIVYLLLIGRIMGRCVERAKWNGNSDNTVINQ